MTNFLRLGHANIAEMISSEQARAKLAGLFECSFLSKYKKMCLWTLLIITEQNLFNTSLSKP